jgi:hypothetical protein
MDSESVLFCHKWIFRSFLSDIDLSGSSVSSIELEKNIAGNGIC